MSLRLLVVCHIAVRCICSGSAAGFPLQVAMRGCGRPAPAGIGRPRTCCGGVPLATSTICASFALATPTGRRDQPSYIILIRQFHGCPIRNLLRPSPSNLTASLYHLFEPGGGRPSPASLYSAPSPALRERGDPACKGWVSESLTRESSAQGAQSSELQVAGGPPEHSRPAQHCSLDVQVS